MGRVSVITGGAGGMGLATAKVVGRDHTVVLCDVRQDRLDTAAATLKDLGVPATAVNCDVTDRRGGRPVARDRVRPWDGGLGDPYRGGKSRAWATAITS